MDNTSENNNLKIDSPNYNIRNDKIILDDFNKEHLEINNIILNDKLNLYNKITNIIELCDKIKYPKNFNYYNAEDYYRDKYKYLLSSKLDNKFRI